MKRKNIMKLIDLKQQQKAALDKAEALLGASDHVMTTAETEGYSAAMAEYNNVTGTIKARESLSTIKAAFPNGQPSVDNREQPEPSVFNKWRVKEYAQAFTAFTRSRGRDLGAALALGADELGGFKFPGQGMNAAAYETNATDGVAIYPSQVDQQFIPLAPPEIGVETIATVIPTVMDIKFPRKKVHGTAAAKAEGTGSGANLFTGTDPQSEQVTLGAGMIGHPEDASWELLQDVAVFQSFMTADILLSLAILKENYYVNGGGSCTGLIGNTGAGITGVTAASEGETTLGNAILDATFDVQGVLNAVYHPNANFLMTRATSIVLRKAQKQANLFEPVFVTVGGKSYLHGYEVAFSTSMPAATTGLTPILFGDFKAGYMIGVRGGAGVNVKILDQPKALEGLITVLGYQRVGSIIRRSEAIQAITLG
jgi:HK97 family phage major capsid protein